MVREKSDECSMLGCECCLCRTNKFATQWYHRYMCKYPTTSAHQPHLSKRHSRAAISPWRGSSGIYPQAVFYNLKEPVGAEGASIAALLWCYRHIGPESSAYAGLCPRKREASFQEGQRRGRKRKAEDQTSDTKMQAKEAYAVQIQPVQP